MDSISNTLISLRDFESAGLNKASSSNGIVETTSRIKYDFKYRIAILFLSVTIWFSS